MTSHTGWPKAWRLKDLDNAVPRFCGKSKPRRDMKPAAAQVVFLCVLQLVRESGQQDFFAVMSFEPLNGIVFRQRDQVTPFPRGISAALSVAGMRTPMSSEKEAPIRGHV